MTRPDDNRPLRITGLLPRANDRSLGVRGWKDAGIRIRCLTIAPHLGNFGPAIRLVESLNLDDRIADRSFFDADVYVIYQTLEDHRPVVATLLDAGKCVVVDVCDEVSKHQGVLSFTWDNARRATAVTVPTRNLAARLAPRTDTPIYVVPDAVEGERQPIRPPRGDGPLRLFWYGWQHKIGTLAQRLPALAEFARRRPLDLTIMSNLDPVQPLLRGMLGAAGDRLAIRAVPWLHADFNAAMEQADIAIVPYDDSVAYSGRSPVRVIQAAWQGRLAISEDVEGYPELARFGVLHRSIVDGIAWALDHPHDAARQLELLQACVAESYRPQVVAKAWLRSLRAIHTRFVAARG